MAETYNIYNYKGLYPELVATLVFGLRAESRLKMKISGQRITLDQMLAARQADALNMLLWTKTKDAQKNKNRPKSILQSLMGMDEEQREELMSFKTPEEYEAHINAIRGNTNGE